MNAADDPAKNRLAALLEQGDLLLHEAATLVPETNQIKQEGEKIIASERSLLMQSNALAKAFEQYNTDVAQQQNAAKDWRDRCRGVSGDAELKLQCDAEVAELSPQGIKLEERLSALDARREALTERIAQHNAARLK